MISNAGILSCFLLFLLDSGSRYTQYSTIGIRDLSDPYYFITRHPKPIRVKVNPFGSLPTNVWLVYTSCYLIFTAFIIVAHFILSPGHTFNMDISLSFMPSSAKWLNILKMGLMVQTLFSFSCRSLNVSFNVDMWTNLMKQKFEV